MPVEDIFGKLAKKIITEQEGIIGPLAIEQARKVPGLSVDWQKDHIVFEGNKTDVLEKLVEKYKDLFGQASVEVCKDAVRGLIADLPKEQVPSLLR